MDTSGELIAEMKREGLSYSQIAERIGTSRNAVAGILHRTRNPTPKKEIRCDLWTEARLTEKWENRKRRTKKLQSRY